VDPALLSLASVIGVSLASLTGLIAVSWREANVRRIARWFVSFAVGGLLGDAFIHLVPAAYAGGAANPPLRPSLLILGGMLAFFVVEKLLRHRHHADCPVHAETGPDTVLATINVLGDAIHNFIDGLLIGASYVVSPTLGVSTTLAVLLHEIPQEMGDFGILVHSGLSIRQAVVVNLASASVAIFGTVSALLLETIAREAVAALVPVAAGGFIYLAAADLIPELQHDRSLRALIEQSGLIAAGIAFMVLLAAIE
jgi:zinc and cadmium transporter